MDSDSEDEEDNEMSVKDRLLGLVARVSGLRQTSTEEEECRPQGASKSIYVLKALSLSPFEHFCALEKQLPFITLTCNINLPVRGLKSFLVHKLYSKET